MSLPPESGYVPNEVVRQNTDFATQPGIAMTSGSGSRLRIWIEPSTGDTPGKFSQHPSVDDPMVTEASAMIRTADQSQQLTVEVSGDSKALDVETAELLTLIGVHPSPDLANLSKSLTSHGWLATAQLDSTLAPFGKSWSVSYRNKIGQGIRTVVYAASDGSNLSIALASLIFPYTITQRETTSLIYFGGGGGVPPMAWFASDTGYLVLISADVKDPLDLLAFAQQLRIEPVDDLMRRSVSAP